MKSSAALLILAVAAIVITVVVSANGQSSTDRGREVYTQYCQRCHGADGAGGKGLYKIQGRQVWQQSSREIILVLAFGASGRTVYGEAGLRLGMPPAPYSDADLAAVAVYAMKTIGKRGVTVRTEDVVAVKQAHLSELRARLMQ
ncbi:MAG: cytochrome c [Candidatus Kapabacteria bacterium]|nr:cytochrome c [Candidatus Kapabacteria bacterium]